MLRTVIEEVVFGPYYKECWRENRREQLYVGSNYILLIRGKFYYVRMDNNCSTFRLIDGKVLYGWHSGQFDPPGTNGCRTQKVWRVFDDKGLTSAEAILLCAGIDPVELSISLELEFAKDCRQYAIDYKCTSNGQRITDSAPIEAFYYRPTVQANPPNDDGDDDD